MKKILFSILLIFSISTIIAQETPKNTSTTTYYLVRHAEKDVSDKTNRNPKLTEIGRLRASNLVSVLEEVEFDEIYSTDYIRTKDTAKPLAEANNLEIIFYNPREIDYQKFKKRTKGKKVMIVGHSNTTPIFANELLGKDLYENLDESIYNNLYIVTVTEDTANSMILKIN